MKNTKFIFSENSNIFFTILIIFIPYLSWLIRNYHNIDDMYDKNNKNTEKNIKKILRKKIKNKKNGEKIKIGLLTNELPPIIYGGVSTWVLNFMKMFKNDENYDVIPIFLSLSR